MILVERGLGGSFTLRWGEHESALAMAQSWDYEVYWTVPTEEPPESCCQYDQEDHRLVAVRSVWRYPGAVFFRKLQGTVEAQLQPPEADSLGLQEVRFAVRAVDPVSRAVSLMGDLGPAVALPTAAEAILRDVEAVNQLGAGAVAAGGFKRFLEDAEDAGTWVHAIMSYEPIESYKTASDPVSTWKMKMSWIPKRSQRGNGELRPHRQRADERSGVASPALCQSGGGRRLAGDAGGAAGAANGAL